MIFGLLLAAVLLQDPIEEARALIENGRSLQALQKLEQASRAQPDDAAIHHALGTLYVAAGRMQEALASLGRAASLDPEEPTYAFAYGELLYRSGRPEEALRPLEQASDLPEALILVAAVYEKLGPKEEMFSTLARYLELRPGDTGTRLVLGQQLEAAKRYHEALAVYRGESEDPVLLYHAANVLARDRETYSESETLVRKALEASPENLEAGLLLARVLERQQRYQKALDELERLR